MVRTKADRRVNDNTYLFDGMLLNIPRFLGVYIIENEGMRVMIDTPADFYVRKFLKQLQELDLYPIHKIVITHSHFDHMGGAAKIKRMIKNVDVEVLASVNGLDNLKNPERMNDVFGFNPTPVDNATGLKEGDIIDVNGLKLEVLDLSGHTMDCIGILDKKNRTLFPSDISMIRWDHDTFIPTNFPPDFHESEFLKSLQKIKERRDEYDLLSVPHYGAWKGDDKDKLLDHIEDLYFKSKEAFVEWYKDNLSIDDIVLNYCEKFIPNSKKITKENSMNLKMVFEWLIESLKISGFI